MFELTILLGFLMIVVGILVLVLATLIEFFKTKEKQEGEKTSVQGGAVIMIGPIPIVLSTDPRSAKILMILAIVLIVVSFLLILVFKGVAMQ